MKNRFYIGLFVFFLGNSLFAQQTNDLIVVQESIKIENTDPLKPSKAAFYSAILPGLGQAYNKDYWKVPIVYAAIGTSAYFYIHNNNLYNDYRDAYKRRLAGFNDDQFQGDNYLSDEILIAAQKQFQRNRDLSMLITIGFYILNVVEANVAAHLKQFNVSDDLSLNPYWDRNEFNNSNNVGLSLTYKF